jgi:hypothetical protein
MPDALKRGGEFHKGHFISSRSGRCFVTKKIIFDLEETPCIIEDEILLVGL